MLRTYTSINGAVVVGLIAALTLAVASLWANPLPQARAPQTPETPGEAQLIGTLLTARGCPGDIDGDGSVGASDLLFLLFSWGPCDDCNDCSADFDGNCIVGSFDLLTLLFNWGRCP